MPGGYLTSGLDQVRTQTATTLVYFQKDQYHNYSYFRTRAYEVGRLITRYLIERGHRRIGLIAPQNSLQITNLAGRVEGMKEVLEQAGYPNYREYPVDGPNLDEMRQVARQLQSDPNRPTAIYGFSDEYSFPLLRALLEQGFRVPHDVALIGADNTPMCDYTSPSLTSVSLNVKQVAEQAIDAIVQRKDGKESSITEVESKSLPFLVQREST
jgi:DNA-binding LacI/PurR family transcriptional regulator